MSKNLLKLALASATAAIGIAAGTASVSAQEVSFTCYSDGNYCDVARDVLDRFEAANDGITVKIDVVPYKAILETLPVQLAAGEGPDMALVTDLGGLSKYYLNLAPHVDTKYWEDNFGGTLDWYRPAGDEDGIYGMHSQLTITGAYVNKTLFEQAGVAMPDADASWDDWAAAATAVAKATETPFPMAMDRSGHRIAGPAMSYGAKWFDDNGDAILIDDGLKGYVEKFVGWHNDGTMARDVWAGTGGDSYQPADKEFINGELVYYYSGSWNTGKMDTQVGDAFDWVITGSPCGDGGCTGMPGGAGIVGFGDTENPEAVAKVINFLAQEENYGEIAARTLNIPSHLGVASKGLSYNSASPAASAALNA